MSERQPQPAHLDEATAAMLGRSERARINWLYRRRLFRYRAFEDAERVLLDALYRCDDEPAKTIMLTGAAGAGKKRLVESLLPEHGHPYIDERIEVAKPIIWPAEPIAMGASQLAHKVLKHFHGAIVENDEDLVAVATRWLGKMCSVQLLVVHEMWTSEKKPAWAAIEQWRAEAGTSAVVTVSAPEGIGVEWATRSEHRVHLHLPGWTPGRELAHLLDDVQAGIPLPEDSGLRHGGGMMERIARHGGNNLGSMLEVVREAGARAIRAGRPRINQEDVRRPGTGQTDTSTTR